MPFDPSAARLVADGPDKLEFLANVLPIIEGRLFNRQSLLTDKKPTYESTSFGHTLEFYFETQSHCVRITIDYYSDKSVVWTIGCCKPNGCYSLGCVIYEVMDTTPWTEYVDRLNRIRDKLFEMTGSNSPTLSVRDAIKRLFW